MRNYAIGNSRLSDLVVINVNILVTSKIAEDPDTVIDHFAMGDKPLDRIRLD